MYYNTYIKFCQLLLGLETACKTPIFSRFFYFLTVFLKKYIHFLKNFIKSIDKIKICGTILIDKVVVLLGTHNGMFVFFRIIYEIKKVALIATFFIFVIQLFLFYFNLFYFSKLTLLFTIYSNLFQRSYRNKCNLFRNHKLP